MRAFHSYVSQLDYNFCLLWQDLEPSEAFRNLPKWFPNFSASYPRTKRFECLNSKTFSVYFTHRNLFHFSIFSLCKLFRHDGQLMTSKQWRRIENHHQWITTKELFKTSRHLLSSFHIHNTHVLLRFIITAIRRSIFFIIFNRHGTKSPTEIQYHRHRANTTYAYAFNFSREKHLQIFIVLMFETKMSPAVCV
jgi:hypothetical protein